MKKMLRLFVVGILFLLVVFGSFVLGFKYQEIRRGQIALEVDNTGQAMLWFNHLRRYRQIEADLSKGCSDEALEKTRISIDQEMNLLSNFYEENKNTWLNKYISDRDPALLGQLETFKSKYGNSWTEPQCKK